MRVCVGRTQGMQIQMGLVEVLLHDPKGFHGVLSFTTLILGRLLQVLEEGEAITLVLHLQEMLSALALLLHQLSEETAHTLENHIVSVEVGAQRELGVGGQQMQVGKQLTAASTSVK